MIRNVEKLPRERVQDIIELTPLQEGLLFHHVKDQHSQQYHEQLCLTIRGPIDQAHFLQAWEYVVRSNEMLRTVFRWHGLKKPVQIILKHAPVQMTYTNISHLEPSAQQRAIEELRQADYARPFTLLEVPFRIHLCQLSDQQAFMMVSNHHILYDGWSNAILLQEFFRSYELLYKGEQLSLPTKTPFTSYLRWLQRQDAQQQERFWRGYLQGFHAQTPLPIVRKHAGAGRTAARYRVICPPEMKQKLESFCRTHQVTLAAVLYSAFGLVVQKYANTEDIVFGTTVSGRTADIPDIVNMVGLFINAVPLRVRGSQEQSILALVQQINSDLIARMAFDTTPLVSIKSASSLEARDELFTTIMVVENYPLDEQLLKQTTSLTISDFSLTEMTSYDLTINVNLLFEAVEILFTYTRECVDEAALVTLAGSLLTVLLRIIEHPELCLRDVELLSSQEKERILSQVSAPPDKYTVETTLQQVFAAQVERFPHRPAVISEGEVLTYRQLDEHSGRLASYLQRYGVGSESIVGVCAERSLDMMVAIFAIIKAGGAYLPLDPRLPPQRLQYILADSGTKLVLCQQRWKAPLEGSCPLLYLEDPDLYTLSPLEGAEVVSPESLAYVIYTSGSTGAPKGVLIEHRSVVNRLQWAQRYLHLAPEDVILQKTNIMFDVSVWELFGWLFGGAALCLLPPEAEADPKAIIACCAGAGVTIMHFVPSMFQHFLDYLHQHPAGPALHRLRCIITSGEALRASHVAQVTALLPAARLVNLYGPTEATIDVSAYQCTREDSSRENVPIGRPIDNIRLYVLNDSHTLQPLGVPGELYIAGIGVARGYINAPELTAQRFMPDPFDPQDRMYRTGDLARWLPNGQLEYLGRRDHQVKLRGFRVELPEIEVHLQQLPEIKEAVALVVRDAVGDDRLVAYVVPQQKAGIDPRSIRQALAAKVPDYMIPDTYIELERLPLSPTGKADRRRLQQMAVEQQHRSAGGPSPDLELSDVERIISEVWAEVLGVEQVHPDVGFFEMGGNSLKILRVCNRLMTVLQVDLPVTALFQYPTVRSLACYLATTREKEKAEANPTPEPAAELDRTHRGTAVAVIGMAGRFPGARTIEEFWHNLSNGVESISFFSPEELAAAGIPADLLENTRYVRAKGVLEGVDRFDAAFFGYTPREAQVMDPQLRLLHEVVWEALEDAGYNPETYSGAIGLYAGSSSNFHWLEKIARRVTGRLDEFALMLLNEKDFLSSRLAYKMNLRGPGVTIQTACSTSLAAIHYAYQELLNGHCDMAVAGGVSITYPVKAGYLYEEGMVFSPDGHCRAFDAQAGGTVGGNGVGVVVLKRLDEALEQGDHIYAVIKGSAMNNDGVRKVSFTAPGIDGQAQVIEAAQRMTGVPTESITYIEAHGTGTELGDPIEIAALSQAFQRTGRQFCAIGSVKSNIGHLDAAAGVASFIKTVLALKHAQLPPSLHFHQPNPRCHFAESPFYIVTERTRWQRNGTPLRAGISSFGMGGTNVHLVLEERPDLVPVPCSGAGTWQILPFSARTASSLQNTLTRFRTHLLASPELDLADVAYTLQVGRKPFATRTFIICSSPEEAIAALDERASPTEKSQSLWCAPVKGLTEASRDIVFFFPGQGSQYVNMGADLYQHFWQWKEVVDHCCDLVQEISGRDLREVLYPQKDRPEYAELINQTEYSQPLLFIYEYALAHLLMSWGIKPTAMIGHSVGEYVAACLAGVFSLQDALRLVVSRGRLMQRQPSGSMLGVALPEQELTQRLPADLSVAAVNSRTACVVSGPTAAIEAFAAELRAQGCTCRMLVTSHAFHSPMMEPVLEEFSQIAASVTLHPPCIPFISNSSGTWVRDEEATSPEYWARHLRTPVRFADGVALLQASRPGIFIEVGPGKALTELVRKNLDAAAGVSMINLCRHPQERLSDVQPLLRALGSLWQAGVAIDWQALHQGERRHRVSLPTYAFEGERFWPDEPQEPQASPSIMLEAKQQDIANWFALPSWERSSLPVAAPGEVTRYSWMVLALHTPFSQAFIRALRTQGARVIVVYPAEQYEQRDTDEYSVRPQQANDFKTVLERTHEPADQPKLIVHLWSSGEVPDPHNEGVTVVSQGLYALGHLVRALTEHIPREKIRLIALTSGIEQVTGSERLCPWKATIYGFTKICPIEYPQLACRTIDLDLDEMRGAFLDNGNDDIETLIAECLVGADEVITAYRGGYRWSKVIRPARLDRSPLLERRLREGGVYLITGGLGGIGLALAGFFAQEVRGPTLILVGRSAFPERPAWQDWIHTHGLEDRTSQRIRQLLAIEARGAQIVVFSVDLADEAQVTEMVRTIEQRYGPINGVVHAAGIADYAGMLQTRSDAATAAVLAPKVQGTVLLDRLLNRQALDFVVLCSSIGNVIYQQKFGQSGYNAANEFLDAYAHYRRRQGKTFWVSINWSDWQEAGMSLKSAVYWAEKFGVQAEEILADGMTNAEGIEVFRRILGGVSPQVIVSPQTLTARVRKATERFRALLTMPQASGLQKQEAGSSDRLVSTIDDLEEILTQIWQHYFGQISLGRHDNFFDLGADSFDLVQANSAIQQRLNVELPLVALYEHPTIASLARFLRSERSANEGGAAEASRTAPERTQELEKARSLLKHTTARMKKR